MTVTIRSLVPMAHVRSIARSVAFYDRLGFRVENSFTPPDEREPSWVSLVSGDARLMLTRADAPVVGSQQAVLFYAYFDDTAIARERLIAAGIEAGPIEFPFYAPRGEFRIHDPDGYVLMVTHT